ncbi:TetR/AcrR family transcriptional regulator [Streptomyces sp. SAJ15]|uniref:TetR/AcrR family transcriptional regulator n=1 Tax=Streptomyces sp. SAJ15 TaxID=2011095 RepID=UPI001185E06F|nr:TetR/AcrR family transcriptional regulator [Streptomyces sp. SAJ15]TVL93901.1 TetR family transcriptional regulator [Streptomyces sp. SAJ15]
MARPRTFDEQRAVDAAMGAFWAAGYEATSTQELCEATGLGRSSIYNTFKSKHDLFRRAFARYVELRAEQQAELLGSDLSAREKIRTMMTDIVAEVYGESDVDWVAASTGRGCFFVNTAIELSGRDPEIAELLKRDYQARFEAFRAVIESGQRAGDLDRGGDPGRLAHFLIATISGLRVSAQAGCDRAGLEGAVETALAAL